MLCGFANFASIGIQIGGIGGIAPNQRKNLSKFGLMAVLGGTLASLLSACLVGALLGWCLKTLEKVICKCQKIDFFDFNFTI